MSIELIGILTVGAALAAMNLATLRSVRTEVRTDIRGVRDELHGVRGELRGDIRAVDDRVRALDDRMRTQERSTAKLEGLLEGLREAVAVRRPVVRRYRPGRASTAANRRGADRLPGARQISASPLRRATRQRQGRYVIRPTGNSASTINHGMGRHARRDVSSPFQQTITDLAQRDDLAQVRREPA